MRFTNLRLGTRLTLGFGVVLALVVVMMLLSVWRIASISAANSAILQQPLAKERLAGEWYRNIAAAVQRTAAIALATDASMEAYFADEAKASSTRSSVLQKKLEVTISTDSERELLAAIGEVRKEYIASRDSIMKSRRENNAALADEIFKKRFQPVCVTYLAAMDKLLEYYQGQISSTGRDVEAQAANGKMLMLVLGSAAVVLGAIVAWLLTRSITVPLAAAVQGSERVARGDLSAVPTSTAKDEIGDLVRAQAAMVVSLRSIIDSIRVSTESITSASSEIAIGNNDLSSRTEQQASNLEQTASAMEQMTSTVQQNADAARQANQLAVTASEIATRGGAEVSRVVITMGDITQSSKKIADIISVIDGIAFQTNILALNAAVEAARAGEQGRGFAVVASEVRNLAQRSAEAAKEIKTLIGTSVEKVDAGTKLVADAGATMEEIVQSVKRVTDIIGEITAATQEQSTGITQVNQAVGQLDQMTQQNAALVEQSAAAAESLKDQAAKLSQAMSVFKLAEGKSSNVLRVEKTAGLKAQVAISKAMTPAKTAAPASTAKRPPPLAKRASANAGAPIAMPTASHKVLSKAADDEWEEF